MPSPTSDTPVGIIFKQGDDLRQDMLIIQVEIFATPGQRVSVFCIVERISPSNDSGVSCSDPGVDGVHLAGEISGPQPHSIRLHRHRTKRRYEV